MSRAMADVKPNCGQLSFTVDEPLHSPSFTDSFSRNTAPDTVQKPAAIPELPQASTTTQLPDRSTHSTPREPQNWMPHFAIDHQ